MNLSNRQARSDRHIPSDPSPLTDSPGSQSQAAKGACPRVFSQRWKLDSGSFCLNFSPPRLSGGVNWENRPKLGTLGAERARAHKQTGSSYLLCVCVCVFLDPQPADVPPTPLRPPDRLSELFSAAPRSSGAGERDGGVSGWRDDGGKEECR